jgi:hypothetical protein
MDYDKDVDFSKYKHYDYFLVEETGLSQLDEKRIVSAIGSYLKSKNIVEKSIPEFSINYYAEVYTVQTENSIGVGLGTGGGSVGGGVSGGIPLRTEKEMIALTIEFVDALTKELFWQGVIEARIKETKTPDEKEAFINELVAKILENYPPKQS